MSSSLREQLIDQMTLEGLSECTKKSYVAAVKGLAKFYNLPPIFSLTNRFIPIYTT